MLRSAGSRATHQLKRLVSLQQPGNQLQARNFWHRGGSGRNLPVAYWGRSRGPWGLDDIASRMMDRHMRQMERMMDDMLSGPVTVSRMWPRWAEWGEGMKGDGKGDVEHVKYDSKEFEVKLDVSSYKPEELNVKVNKDRLTISAKHEEKPDEHGYVSREFTRHFSVPEDVDGETMETILTHEGALIVRAKVKGAENNEGRTLNIQREAPKEEKTD